MNTVQVGLPDGGSTLAVGVEPESVDVAVSFDDVEGSWDDLGPGAVAVQRIEADNRGYSLGDAVDLTVGEEPYPAEVVAIFDFSGEVSDSQSYYLHYREVERYLPGPRDFSVSVAFEPDADFDRTAGAVEEALSDFPSVQVTTVSDLVEQVRTALTAVVGMVAGLLLMSVVVAVVGIVLTLYLAVYERTRETGMLRAVGMTRRQVRKMIRFESVLIAVFGTLLGLVVGLFCGWALAVGVVGEGVSLSVPWLWVAFGLIGALVAGVAAAVIPARRAARMNVLEAIAYE
ncbi:MAG: ABC transporter permease, partial [Actinomycetota bacterium]